MPLALDPNGIVVLERVDAEGRHLSLGRHPQLVEEGFELGGGKASELHGR